MTKSAVSAESPDDVQALAEARAPFDSSILGKWILRQNLSDFVNKVEPDWNKESHKAKRNDLLSKK